nr:glycosyltransferase family 39 protein [Kitasatospora sp. MMS16-BH015]
MWARAEWARAVWPPVLLALALGLWGITRQDGIWRDEVVTHQVARRSLPELWHLLGSIDAVHGLYYLLMHGVFLLGDAVGLGPDGGGGLVALRLPSVLATALAAGLLADLGRRLAGWTAGLAAGLVFALLPAVQQYAQEGRSYALVTTAVVGATWQLVRVWQRGAVDGRAEVSVGGAAPGSAAASGLGGGVAEGLVGGAVQGPAVAAGPVGGRVEGLVGGAAPGSAAAAGRGGGRTEVSVGEAVQGPTAVSGPVGGRAAGVRGWAGYGALVLLGGLLHEFAVLGAAAHGLSLLLGRAGRRLLLGWALAVGGAGLCLLPLVVVSGRQADQVGWITTPGWADVWAPLLTSAAGALCAWLLRRGGGRVGGRAGLAVADEARSAASGAPASGAPASGWAPGLGVVGVPLLVVPPAVLILVSYLDPLYVDRYVVYSYAGLALLVGGGLARGLGWLPGRWRLLVGGWRCWWPCWRCCRWSSGCGRRGRGRTTWLRRRGPSGSWPSPGTRCCTCPGRGGRRRCTTRRPSPGCATWRCWSPGRIRAPSTGSRPNRLRSRRRCAGRGLSCWSPTPGRGAGRTPATGPRPPRSPGGSSPAGRSWSGASKSSATPGPGRARRCRPAGEIRR